MKNVYHNCEPIRQLDHQVSLHNPVILKYACPSGIRVMGSNHILQISSICKQWFYNLERTLLNFLANITIVWDGCGVAYYQKWLQGPVRVYVHKFMVDIFKPYLPSFSGVPLWIWTAERWWAHISGGSYYICDQETWWWLVWGCHRRRWNWFLSGKLCCNLPLTPCNVAWKSSLHGISVPVQAN